MQRFVCEQNISHFQKLLDGSADPTLRHTLEALLASAKRELALLNSELQGADSVPPRLRRHRIRFHAGRLGTHYRTGWLHHNRRRSGYFPGR